MTHLYFCRHGQSELNLRGIYAGQTDTPLTDRGRSQAHTAGLQASLLGIDLIVASPLARALETATIIAEQVGYPVADILTNDLLKERSLGSLEGKSWQDYAEDEQLFPDIESLEHLGGRAQQALNYLRTLTAANVLVVGHGSFALALCELVGYDTGGQELPNAHVVQLI